MSEYDDWDEDEHEYDDFDDESTLCGSCGRKTDGLSECAECGVPLCSMCHECGCGFCSLCPTDDFVPPWDIG